MASTDLLGNTAAGAVSGSAGGPVGTIVGAGIGLASSIASGLFGSHNTKVANEMSLHNAKEMARINDLYQRRIIKDSPMLQKQGLEAAGLSPALVDNISSVTSSDANATPPTAKAAPVPQLFNASDFAALRNADSQRIVAEAQAKNLDADTEGKQIDNQTKGDLNIANLKKIYAGINLNDAQVSEIQSNISKINQDIVESASRVKLNDAQINYLQSKGFNETWDMLLKNEKLQYEINLMVAQTNMSNAQALDLVKKVASGYWESVVNSNNAGAAASMSQVGLNNALAGQANANTSFIKSQTFGQDLKNIYTSGTVDGAVKAANAGNSVDGSKFVRWTDKVTTWLGTIGGTVANGVKAAAAAALAF